MNKQASKNLTLNGPHSEKGPSQVSNNGSVTNPNWDQTYCSDKIASASQLVAKVESNLTSVVVENEQSVAMERIDFKLTETAKNNNRAKSDDKLLCDCKTKIGIKRANNNGIKETLAPQAKINKTESFLKHKYSSDLQKCDYFTSTMMQTQGLFYTMLCFAVELIMMTILVIGFAYVYCNDKHDFQNKSVDCVLKIINRLFGSETNMKHVLPYPVPNVSLRIPLKQKEVEDDPDPPDKTFLLTLV